jgi:hypothetical protein
MNLSKLSDHFQPEDVEWRVQSSGKKGEKAWAMVLAYITNRAIMERLDQVCGPENWRNEFKESPAGGVLCGISIKCSDEWVTKWDGAENTAVEAVKGGLSSAMKRAGVQWGIGRYLYNLDVTWANVHPNGKHSSKTKDNMWFKWDQPELPQWALPALMSKEVVKDYASKIFRCSEDDDAEGIAQLVDELSINEKKRVLVQIPHDVKPKINELLKGLR